MNQRETAALDRWITGNYGEDQFAGVCQCSCHDDPPREGEFAQCDSCYEAGCRQEYEGDETGEDRNMPDINTDDTVFEEAVTDAANVLLRRLDKLDMEPARYIQACALVRGKLNEAAQDVAPSTDLTNEPAE